jgi:hypothetical protein
MLARHTPRRGLVLVVTLVAGSWVGLGTALAQELRLAQPPTPAELGLVAEGHGGGSKYFGPDGPLLKLGYRAGGTLGLEVPVGGAGSRFSVTPELMGSYERWAGDIPLGLFDAGESMLTVQAGCRFSYYVGPVGLWGAVHAGYARVAANVKMLSFGVGAETSLHGVAANLGTGADVMLTRFLGIGPYLDVTTSILHDGTRVGRGPIAMDFGLRLKLKVPL